MKVITRELVAQVSAEARQNPRLRKNHNLHPSDQSRCQRLMNAIEPASYIPPHRHLDPEKDEAFILLNGKVGVVTFNDMGAVAESVLLSHSGGALAVDIPHGIYHTAVSLESGTVIYETKAGPYLPVADSEKAPWAPRDHDPHSQRYLQQLRSLFE